VTCCTKSLSVLNSLTFAILPKVTPRPALLLVFCLFLASNGRPHLHDYIQRRRSACFCSFCSWFDRPSLWTCKVMASIPAARARKDSQKYALACFVEHLISIKLSKFPTCTMSWQVGLNVQVREYCVLMARASCHLTSMSASSLEDLTQLMAFSPGWRPSANSRALLELCSRSFSQQIRVQPCTAGSRFAWPTLTRAYSLRWTRATV